MTRNYIKKKEHILTGLNIVKEKKVKIKQKTCD